MTEQEPTPPIQEEQRLADGTKTETPPSSTYEKGWEAMTAEQKKALGFFVFEMLNMD